MSKILLKCENICKTYTEGNISTQVLKNVNFTLNEGSLSSIVGSSGSGKSTLLHILGTLDKPTKGSVFFNDTNIHKMKLNKQASFRNSEVGFIYQFHHLLNDFNAIENVSMALLIAGTKRKHAELEAKKMLQRVNLGHRLKHRPSELSGGERQRVAIARALIRHPKLILADEPTGNLDFKTAEETFNLIKELNRDSNCSFLIVTHDNDLARKTDNILTMQDGKLAYV